jgi:hypothetical protein
VRRSNSCHGGISGNKPGGCLIEGGRHFGEEALADMSKQSRYSIEIKDDTGKTVIFTADWTVDERRFAVAQIRRLADVKRGASPTRPQGNRAASLAET